MSLSEFRSAISAFKAKLARRLSRSTFHFLERHFDLHLTYNEYYSPIPSVKDLPADTFDKPFSMTGVDMKEAVQLEFLETVLPKYMDEYQPVANDGLSLVDAYVLYAMIRERKPRTIVEIGGGNSTLISMKAVEKNRELGFPCHFTCIEPYPRKFLLDASWPDYELITELVQNVPVSRFDGVDLLFIDSSHVSKIGSDVNYEFLEIVPHTPVGCLIHWHDIAMPKNYWRDWIRTSGQFWNESYMLHAFLLFNKSFEIRWAACHMQAKHLPELKSRFPYLKDQHRLSSFWVERIA